MAIDAANSLALPRTRWDFYTIKHLLNRAFKAAVQHSEYLKARYGQTYTKADIFRSLGVSSTRGWAIIRDYERTFHNNPFTDETRGRKKKLSDEDIDTLERFLWKMGWKEELFHTRRFLWKQVSRPKLAILLYGEPLVHATGEVYCLPARFREPQTC